MHYIVSIEIVIGYVVAIMVTFIALRFLTYFRSFVFHWPRYRIRHAATLRHLEMLPELPYVKVQITTRGSEGTTEVIRRGIQNVVALAREAPQLYADRVSVEVVTESPDQQVELERDFDRGPIAVEVFVIPPEYETPNGTKMKARGLHYMVERRIGGLNAKPGRTFIVHYDEESVMEPTELRKLIRHLSMTDKKIMEGPIYYPLEYTDASLLCRAMEAQRPIGCFECRAVMERGVPLHLHGSNLVVDEALENQLGWDIGTLDGQPFIAEDYVFGARAYLQEGPGIFGWHGSVMLEQPPFSLRSAFKQRYRWILGVMQGVAATQRTAEFQELPGAVRRELVWGTRYRIATFALGLPTGLLGVFYVSSQAGQLAVGGHPNLLPLPVTVWLVFCAVLWFSSVVIGAWYNVTSARQLSPTRRLIECLKIIAVAPVAGILESAAGFSAVWDWVRGRREVQWVPTPKTRQADQTAHEEVVSV
jgi:hypothetical protein